MAAMVRVCTILAKLRLELLVFVAVASAAADASGAAALDTTMLQSSVEYSVLALGQAGR